MIGALIVLGLMAWTAFALRGAKRGRGCGGNCANCPGCGERERP